MTAGGAVPNVYQADVSCRAVVFAKPWAGSRACRRKRALGRNTEGTSRYSLTVYPRQSFPSRKSRKLPSVCTRARASCAGAAAWQSRLGAVWAGRRRGLSRQSHLPAEFDILVNDGRERKEFASGRES